MPGSNELIGTILAAVVGVASPAVIVAPDGSPAAAPDCRTRGSSHTSAGSWERDAHALADLLADQGGADTAELLEELNRAGFGTAPSVEPATIRDGRWEAILGRLVTALNGATDPEARSLARSIADLDLGRVAPVGPAAVDEGDLD
ncbi:MAG: hypothetical protein L0H84_08750, partial [Pseudonocardia sp.]|nr:hypothetical protein [Pseudonocardia sp.]